jgi:hypothetical protein
MLLSLPISSHTIKPIPFSKHFYNRGFIIIIIIIIIIISVVFLLVQSFEMSIS